MTVGILELPDAVSLRPMAEIDIPAICDLHARSFTELADNVHTAEQVLAHVGLIRDAAYIDELRRCHMTVAEAAHGLVATSGWLIVEDEPGTARIRKVFVHPAMARRGLGTMMVQNAERQAAEAGYPRLIVRANINAIGLYTRLGYSALRKDVMLGANGVPLPVVMMEKQGCRPRVL